MSFIVEIWHNNINIVERRLQMKSTGIVRKVDELGTVVLPKELRDVLNIDIKDPLEIYTENEFIIFKKYMPGCCLCGSKNNTRRFKDKTVCEECIELISDK